MITLREEILAISERKLSQLENAACDDQGRGMAEHGGRNHEGGRHEVRQEPVVQDCFTPA